MEARVSLPALVEPASELTIDEVRRYSRHLIIPDVGMTGQKRLKNAKVLVVGAGGLGSPALLYLAAAGVGDATDQLAEVYDLLKVEELEGITSARELMLDSQKAGLLFDVASHRPLTPARATSAFESLQDRRLERRLRFGFMRGL